MARPETNKDKLPIISVCGSVVHPREADHGRFDEDGKAFKVAGIGGIAYNVSIGDLACGWVGDHIEPGVSTRNSEDKFNLAYAAFSCIGNCAEAVSGGAKGAKGFITGKHGGCEHIIVHFSKQYLQQMMIGDTILVKSCGQGMELTGFPKVQLSNVSPELFDKMNIDERDGKIYVGVAKIIPGELMGSGIGSYPAATGDYDICLFSPKLEKEYNLRDLRLGDIVAIMNSDTQYGRTYKEGSITIGVVIHSDSKIPGHGPGVTSLMNARNGEIIPFIDIKANLKDIFGEE